MREFFEDGIEILKFFKKKVGGYFSKRGTYLVGIELPIINTPNRFPNKSENSNPLLGITLCNNSKDIEIEYK